MFILSTHTLFMSLYVIYDIDIVSSQVWRLSVREAIRLEQRDKFISENNQARNQDAAIREERIDELKSLIRTENRFFRLPQRDRNGRRSFDDREYNDRRGSYDRDGYDRDGYNRDGYRRDSYDHDGYDRNGYHRDGYDRDGYRRDGYHRDGYHREDYGRHLYYDTPRYG